MERIRLIFLLLPSVHLLDLGGPLQVFQEAIDHGLRADLEYCSASDEVVTSAHLPLGSVKSISQVVPTGHDYVFVPGADINYLLSAHFRESADLLAWLQGAHMAGAHLCSICTGAFALAEARLLDERMCTTHWKRTQQLQALYPKAKVQEDLLFTEDDRIYTSAGVAAGIDLALHIVSKLMDDSISFKVARELVVYVRRSGSDRQQSVFMKFRNHIHTGIHRVQDYVQENMHKGANIPTLSEVACMSTRSLTRTFKRETGVTVNEYVNLVRKERLKELIKNTSFTRKQLAHFCGLKSERQVIRLIGSL